MEELGIDGGMSGKLSIGASNNADKLSIRTDDGKSRRE